MKDNVNRDLEFNNIEVKVNGKKTPLLIGDKVEIGISDCSPKTVTQVVVSEDGRVTYVVEWLDASGEFKQELLTMTEIKLLKLNAFSRPTIGLLTQLQS